MTDPKDKDAPSFSTWFLAESENARRCCDSCYQNFFNNETNIRRGWDAGRESLREELDSARAEVEQAKCTASGMGHGMLTAAQDLANLDEEIARLRDLAKEILDDLAHYATPRRDTKKGAGHEWHPVEIKHESDYEYYPNHVDKEDIERYRQALAGRDEGE